LAALAIPVIDNKFNALVKYQYYVLLILFIVKGFYLAIAHERRNISLIDLLFGLFFGDYAKMYHF
jgi:hypothetical protein